MGADMRIACFLLIFKFFNILNQSFCFRILHFPAEPIFESQFLTDQKSNIQPAILSVQFSWQKQKPTTIYIQSKPQAVIWSGIKSCELIGFQLRPNSSNSWMHSQSQKSHLSYWRTHLSNEQSRRVNNRVFQSKVTVPALSPSVSLLLNLQFAWSVI